MERKAFEQIAATGYEVQFNFQTDETGHRTFSIGVTCSSPRPMTMVGVYALLPHGIPVADFSIGGINQGYEPPPPSGTVPVFLVSDTEDFFGNQCPRCNGYFRSRVHPAIYPITCVYCGLRTEAVQLLSESHRRYLADCVEQVMVGLELEMEPNSTKTIEINLSEVAESANSQDLPKFFHQTEVQQTKNKCSKCGNMSDVLGVFAYCPDCGYRNNLATMTAEISSIRERLNNQALSPERALCEGVSLVDSVIGDYVSCVSSRVPMKSTRQRQLEQFKFHDLSSEMVENLANWFGIRLLSKVGSELQQANTMMLRRHLHEHRRGVVDSRYIEKSGDDSVRVGEVLRESASSVHAFLSVMERVVATADIDFHEIFTLNQWPIDQFEERRPK